MYYNDRQLINFFRVFEFTTQDDQKLGNKIEKKNKLNSFGFNKGECNQPCPGIDCAFYIFIWNLSSNLVKFSESMSYEQTDINRRI